MNLLKLRCKKTTLNFNIHTQHEFVLYHYHTKLCYGSVGKNRIPTNFALANAKIIAKNRVVLSLI